MAHQSVIGAYRGVIGIGFVARTVSYAVGYRRRSTADKAGYFPDANRPGLLLAVLFFPVAHARRDHLAHAVVFVLVAVSDKVGIGHARESRQPATAARRPLRLVIEDPQGELAGEVFDAYCTGLAAWPPFFHPVRDQPSNNFSAVSPALRNREYRRGL